MSNRVYIDRIQKIKDSYQGTVISDSYGQGIAFFDFSVKASEDDLEFLNQSITKQEQEVIFDVFNELDK